MVPRSVRSKLACELSDHKAARSRVKTELRTLAA
jgi:hypothetical protein